MIDMVTESDQPILCFDAHLDIAMNAMEWNRDQRWSVAQVRRSEAGMTDKPDRAKNTVSFPALRKGRIGLVCERSAGCDDAGWLNRAERSPAGTPRSRHGPTPRGSFSGTVPWKKQVK